jgi:hypothetical protein
VLDYAIRRAGIEAGEIEDFVRGPCAVPAPRA